MEDNVWECRNDVAGDPGLIYSQEKESPIKLPFKAQQVSCRGDSTGFID